MIDRRLKVRHIRTFVEIARQRSLKRAAERLNLTQPAISKTLKELEEIAGSALLVRGRAGVWLTVEGEAFLRHAETGLAALAQAMRGATEPGEGTLSIGALPSVAARLLPHAVRAFAAIAPDASVRIEDGPHAYLVDRLRGGVLDLVIGRLGAPETMKGLTFTQLYLEDVVVVCAPDHPLAMSDSLDALSGATLIYPPEDAAIRPLVDRMMIAAGVETTAHRIESVSSSFGRAMALGGGVLWIISTGVVADDIADGRLVALPIPMGLTAGPIGIMARAEEDASPLSRMFRRAVFEAVAALRLT